MIRVLNQEAKTIASAATIVAALSFASRFVGFIRDRILAGTFGAGDVLDAYYAAFLVPDFLFSLIVVGALSASFIPLFTEYFKTDRSPAKAWFLTNNVLHILGLLMVLLSGLLIFLAQPLAELIAPGFGPSKIAQTAAFMRVMFISNFLLALSVVFGSALQGMKRFFFYSLAPIVYNIGIILGVFILVPAMGAIGLAWGVVLGAALHLLLQMVGVVGAGYTYRFVFDPFHKDVKEVGKLALPRTLGVAVNQVNFFAMTIIATTLAAGSVTIFQFAYNIQFFAIGIVAVSYAVAAFPTLTELATSKRTEEFVEALTGTVRQMLFFLIPSTILFLLLRAQIVRVVVGAGKFGWPETIQTANVLALFTLSFFAQGLVFLLARAFFAHKDTITPFVAGLAATVLNVVAALLFTREFGVVGLGMSFSLAAVVQVALLWAMLRLKVGPLKEFTIIRSLLIISIAALADGIVTQLFKAIFGQIISLDTFIGVLSHGLIAGSAGLVVYGAVAWFLKSPEMISFIEGMQKKFFRRYQPAEVIAKDQTVV